MRLFRFLVNWLCVLTVPLWGGLFLFGAILADLLSPPGKHEEQKRAMAGHKFFWS